MTLQEFLLQQQQLYRNTRLPPETKVLFRSASGKIHTLGEPFLGNHRGKTAVYFTEETRENDD